MNIQDYCHHGNYIEFVMTNNENNIDIPEHLFFKLLQNVKSKGYSCFQKHYKQYVFRNMFYENNDKSEIKIYKTSLTKVNNLNNKVKILVFHKEKLPYHVFPSTTTMHSISFVSKVIFKVNNRIYINFEKKIYSSDNKLEKGQNISFNKIYINYNHDENVDINSIQHAIENAIEALASDLFKH